jgi:hypothetical protein
MRPSLAMTALCALSAACLPPPMGAPAMPLAASQSELGAGQVYQHHLAERPGERLCAPMTLGCSGPSGVLWARVRTPQAGIELGGVMNLGYSPSWPLARSSPSVTGVALLRLWVVEEENLQLGFEAQLMPGWFTLGAPMSVPLTPNLTVWARPYASPLSAHLSLGLSHITSSGLAVNIDLGGGMVFGAPLFGLPADDREGLRELLERGPQRAYPVHLGLSFSHAYTPDRRASPPR